MGDLVQPVKDGKIVNGTGTASSSSKTSSSGTVVKKANNELGKDAFLKLLVTQMQYQDPLNPSSNTEYVSQLATFSQLEQLQNLSATASNSQAYSLVGQNVTIKNETEAGKTEYISGKVDYVYKSGSTVKISVNDKLYSIDDLESVADEAYVRKQNLPGITDKIALKYDADNQENLTFNVNLGKDDSVASKVAILINNNKVDDKLVSLSGNKVTIDKSALSGLKNGTYNVTVAFNNTEYTTVSDKVSLVVENSKVTSDNTNSTTGADSTAKSSSSSSTNTDSTASSSSSSNNAK